MRYVSTRGGVAATALSDAIVASLARDGGLFVPERVPRVALPPDARADDLPAVAGAVLAPFFEGDRLAPELGRLARAALTFGAPLTELAGSGARAHVLELFHGPTAAFKDFGARFLAEVLGALDGAERTVLVATSGDTGGAVAAAFHGRAGVRVVVLYPAGGVSPRQAHQLGCFGGNVRAFAVSGSFDDCQRLVKQAFADPELRARAGLVSANSISLGRLLPQMAYYAAAAWRVARAGREPLGFVVPTGNLGNAFAAVLARAAGAPIGPIVLACNANRVLVELAETGQYRPQPSRSTLANAMDVGDPSNAERLRWLFPEPARLMQAVRADSVDDAAIRASIRAGPGRYGRIWCPHTACAVTALERLRAAGDTREYAIVATAHPAKFETVVEPLIGRTVEPPAALAAMLARPARAEPLPVDGAALHRVLLES